MSPDLDSQSSGEKVRESLYFKYIEEIGMASDNKQITKKRFTEALEITR